MREAEEKLQIMVSPEKKVAQCTCGTQQPTQVGYVLNTVEDGRLCHTMVTGYLFTEMDTHSHMGLHLHILLHLVNDM